MKQYKPTPAREITCERCGIKFYTKKSGVTKYCMECKDIIYDEHHSNKAREKKH